MKKQDFYKNKILKMGLIITAIIVCIIVAVFLIKDKSNLYLVLSNQITGEVYEKYPINNGDSFAVGFIHSVNKNPVIDVYYIENGDIFVEETIYYSFGAGVQTELNENEVLSYKDGSMIISNIHKSFKDTNLTYLVGSVSDHTLLLNGDIDKYMNEHDNVGVFMEENEIDDGELKVISLSNLCGRLSKVTFSCEYY